MHFVDLNDQEMEDMRKAKELKKYGFLDSWKKLYLFQRTIASTEQIIEIANWAKKKNKGERVLLPLTRNGLKIPLLTTIVNNV